MDDGDSDDHFEMDFPVVNIRQRRGQLDGLNGVGERRRANRRLSLPVSVLRGLVYPPSPRFRNRQSLRYASIVA